VKHDCAGGKRPLVAAVRKKRKNDRQVVYAISAPVQPQSKPATILPRQSFAKDINSHALNKYLVSTAFVLFIFWFISYIEWDTTTEGI
jgi:hypothetical protein